MQNDEMHCPYCGELISTDLEKCPACDESLLDIYTICPACAEKITKDSTVCPICGEVLNKSKCIRIDKFPFVFIRLIITRTLLVLSILTLIGFIIWYAYNWYNDPVRKSERMAKNYYALAKKEERAGNIKDSISNYKNALNEKSDFNEAKVPLVKLCIKDKDMGCVLKYIADAYQLNKNDNQLKFYYATSIINEHSKSIPLLKSVVEKDPNNYLANKFVGYYYFKKGEHKIALPYLKKSFDLKYNYKNDTGVEEVFENIDDEGLMLANIYIINEEYTNAINVLDQMINKTGSCTAKELKAEVIQRKNYHVYEKERAKAEAAAKREQDAYNRSRAEYYREQGMDY